MLSLSDGALGDWSTGVPYMYLTPMELSAIDIAVDSRVTFLVPSQLKRKFHTLGKGQQLFLKFHILLLFVAKSHQNFE